MSRPPALTYERTPCPKCGAATVDEAASRCRPTQDETGEYNCPGGDQEDAEGFLLQPSAASLAALDDWYIDQARRDGLI